MIPLPYRILGAVLALIAISGVSFFEGWHLRRERDIAASAQAMAAQAKAQDAVIEQWKRNFQDASAKADKLAADLAARKQQIVTRTVTVIQRVPEYTTVYKEAPNAPPIPIPHAVVPWGAVGLWNDALGAGMPEPAAGASGPSEPPGAPSGADLAPSPYGLGDLVGNAVENFGQYAQCRAQLNALIDFEQQREAAPQGR